MDSTEHLKQAFVSALGIPESTDFSSLAYRSIPEWDSVAHMQLVNDIETSFDIMMSSQDVIDMSSFEKAKEILGKYDLSFVA